jgi:hypothetical protein
MVILLPLATPTYGEFHFRHILIAMKLCNNFKTVRTEVGLGIEGISSIVGFVACPGDQLANENTLSAVKS